MAIPIVSPDFIITGPLGSLDRWAYFAARAGRIRCYWAQREGGPDCEVCKKPAFCCLEIDDALLQILPITSCSTFKSNDNCELLVVTPGKSTKSIDVEKLRKQLIQIVYGLGNGVELFESVRSTSGAIDWIRSVDQTPPRSTGF